MKQKRITKKGREVKERNLFTGGSGIGDSLRNYKPGAHGVDTNYKRSNVRREEQRARRGDWED